MSENVGQLENSLTTELNAIKMRLDNDAVNIMEMKKDISNIVKTIEKIEQQIKDILG